MVIVYNNYWFVLNMWNTTKLVAWPPVLSSFHFLVVLFGPKIKMSLTSTSLLLEIVWDDGLRILNLCLCFFRGQTANIKQSPVHQSVTLSVKRWGANIFPGNKSDIGNQRRGQEKRLKLQMLGTGQRKIWIGQLRVIFPIWIISVEVKSL